MKLIISKIVEEPNRPINVDLKYTGLSIKDMKENDSVSGSICSDNIIVHYELKKSDFLKLEKLFNENKNI